METNIMDNSQRENLSEEIKNLGGDGQFEGRYA